MKELFAQNRRESKEFLDTQANAECRFTLKTRMVHYNNRESNASNSYVLIKTLTLLLSVSHWAIDSTNLPSNNNISKMVRVNKANVNKVF